MIRYLYIIKFNNLYKIGVSNNPTKRLKQLTLGENAKVIHTKEMVNAFKVEKHLHEVYQHKKISGEWFENLTDEDLELLIDFDETDYLEII